MKYTIVEKMADNERSFLLWESEDLSMESFFNAIVMIYDLWDDMMSVNGQLQLLDGNGEVILCGEEMNKGDEYIKIAEYAKVKILNIN